MQDFRKVEVWEKAHDVALHVYEITRAFPKEEMYGLTSQIRRASTSIPINIAEGCGRRSDREMAYFLQIAMGSASELEYQLLLARDLKYIALDAYQKVNCNVEEIKKMLATFIVRIRSPK
jgi:four helix bundle protein